MNKISVLYTTVASMKDAEVLAKKAVTDKMAVCGNMLPGVVSTYIWHNQIENSQEVSMIFKTFLEQKEALKKWMVMNHPYTTPVIILTEVESSEAFQSYINTELKSQ